MFIPHHLPIQRSNIWRKVGEAWKNMLKHMTISPPQDKFQVLNTLIWWNSQIQGIDYGSTGIEQPNLIEMGLAKYDTYGE